MSIKDANHPAWGEPRYFVARPPGHRLGPLLSATLVGDIAGAVEEAWGVAPIVTASTAIGVAAATTCGRYLVSKDPFTTFPIGLYINVLSEPGTLKSPVLAALSGPLKRLQKDEAAVLDGDIVARIRKTEAIAQALKTCQSDMSKALAKGEDTAAIEAHAQGLQMDLDQLREGQFLAPFRPVSFGTDATPEAIVKRAGGQGGRLALLSAEAGILENLAGRYSEGQAKTEFLNSAYDGESYEGSRVGDEGRDIPRPWASMLLTIQPDGLRTLLGNQHMRSRGFLQRWLIVCAPGQPYRARMTMPPIDPGAQALWGQSLEAIWGGHGWTGHRTIDLAPGVSDVLVDFEHDVVTPMYATAAEEGNGLFMGWLGKIGMTTLRVAGVLALTEQHTDWQVTTSAAQAAVEYTTLVATHVDYLLAHGPSAAKRTPRFRVLEALVWGSVGTVRAEADPDPDDTEGSVGFVRVEGGQFTRRSVHLRFKDQAWCETSEDIERVLLDLAGLGWVQFVGRETTDKGGRPREVWALHPEALTHFEAMTGTEVEVSTR